MQINTPPIKSLKNKTQSFSLVELMIVIGIIAILVATAIPNYKAYSIRSQIMEAMGMAASWKQKVTNYYDNNGTLPPGCPPVSGEFASITTSSNTIEHLVWCRISDTNNDSRIEAWLKNIHSEVNGKPLLLYVKVSNSRFLWTCGSHTDPNYQIPCRYLPNNCQYNCAATN